MPPTEAPETGSGVGAYPDLLVERRETGGGRHPVAVVTVNRPKALNALNAGTLESLDRAFGDLDADEGARGIVVTGAGDRAFVAGADIAELAKLDPESALRMSRRGQAVMRRIESCGKPVVAAVNGFALGGGLELALACHLRVAARGAELGLPEVRLGAIPGYGGTQRLPGLVGRGRALRLILTGDRIGAEDAHRWGLVDAIADGDGPDAALEAALDLLDRVLAGGPLAVRSALLAVEGSTSPEGETREAALFGTLAGTDDLKEGTSAFLARRKPNFKGR